MKRRLFSLIFCLSVLVPVAASAQDLAITHVTVHVEPGKVVEDATVVIAGGVIRSVTAKGNVPAGVRVMDGTGKVVTAGLVDAASRLGLIEVGLEPSTREGVFAANGGDAIHAAYDVMDGYNPASVAIPVARVQGVTSSVSTPYGGLISGTGAWFSLRDVPGSEVVVKAPLAMYANLGEAAQASADGSRGLALVKLREVLDDTRRYSQVKGNYERNQARPFAAGRLDLEKLLPVVQGRMPLVIRAHRRSDILAAVRLAREERVRVIIEGGVEAWMVARELAAAGVGVIVDPSRNLPDSFDRIYVRDDLATVLADAGVAVAISSIGRPSEAGTLRQLAGIAVANGLSREKALAALTTVPAQLFAVDRGTLKPGAIADLVLWSGDPFELSSRAEAVLIGGVEQNLRTRQHLLLERYRTLPR